MTGTCFGGCDVFEALEALEALDTLASMLSAVVGGASNESSLNASSPADV